MPESLGDAAQTRAIIEQAIKAMDDMNGRDYVTRTEFRQDMKDLEGRLEIRLENAMLKTRNWVLGGIIASGLIFGGGFLTMMSKFDRVATSVERMNVSLDQRRQWIDESDERDRRQDMAIGKVVPEYTPAPFETRPQ